MPGKQTNYGDSAAPEGIVDPEGVASVGHDVKSKTLDTRWLTHGIKTAFSAETYVSRCLESLEAMCGGAFAERKTPMSDTMHPELDDSPLLNALDHAKFRSLVGCANWLVTLGRFDIAYSVNALS